MSYNILSGSVNFEGAGQGSIEDIVDKHSVQTITGQKTFSNLSSSADVSVVGNLSASINISASAFYANGVLVDPAGGGGISFDGSTANGVLTFKDSDEATVESKLTFNGTVLDFTDTSISGSGNISGSQFYGSWAGSNILGSQVQKASAGGIGDSGGLTLTTTGLASQATPAGTVSLFVDESGTIKKSTIAQILTNQSITDASALGNTGRVLLDGGVGTISSNGDLSLTTSPTRLTVNGEISASSNVNVGGILRADSHISASEITVANNIRHEGDEDTYISFANNSINLILANGAHVMLNGNTDQTTVTNSDFRVNAVRPDLRIINSTGHVGVGTEIPTVPLEVSSSTLAQLKLTNTTAKAAEFTVAANGDLTITPTGSTTIASSLTVNGNASFGSDSAATFTLLGSSVTCNNGLNFDSNTFFISASNDRVGVGTNTPIAKLDVSGAIAITAESVTPNQPLDGQGFIYSKNDGNLYWRSFDKAETSLTTSGTTTIKTAFLSSAPTFSGGDTNEFFIKWSDGTTVSQPDLRSNNQYFLFTGGGFLSKVTAFGSSTTDTSDSNPFTNDLRVKVYVWDANDTSDLAESGGFASGYVPVASVSGSATDIKTTDSGGTNKYHRAAYSINVNHQISASVGIAVSVQGVDAGNNNSKGFNALNLSFHFTDI